MHWLKRYTPYLRRVEFRVHDIGLGIGFVKCCMEGNWKEACSPRFNKANDDREPSSQWLRLEKAPDIILLEGWCVGAMPEPEEANRQ